MPGTRFEDWHHTRFEGDVDAAKALLPLARKVLGFTVQQAAFSGMQTYKHVLPLEGGGRIVGEVNGGIPRVTVFVPPPEPGREPVFPPEDFVVWSRNEALPDGIDDEHPRQILKPPGGNGDDGAELWTTYWFSAGITGYEDFGGRKSTYMAVFPEGLRYAGNLDWRGPNRERIQWYGPSTRYWYDPFVQMVAQYDRKVFMAGQVVLDTDQYIADSSGGDEPEMPFDERYVLGAGIRGLYLYVVQMQAQNLSMPPPNPPDFGPGVYYYFSDGYTPFDVDTVVCRYRLIPHPDGSPGYRVASHSREVIWTGAITRGINPWFFNHDCTEAITFIPPQIQAYGSTTFVPSFDTSTLQKVLTLVHDEDDSSVVPTPTMTDTPVSLAPGGGEAPIAADYDHEGNRVEIRIRRRNLNLPDNATGFLSQRFDILCGGAEVELRDLYREVPTENHWENRRWLMWADAREGVLVMRRQFTHFRDPPGSGTPIPSTQIWLEIWDRGVKVLDRTDGRTDVTDDNNSYGTYIAFNSNQQDRQSNNLGSALAPLLPIYGWCWGNNNLMTPHQITGHHAGFCYLPRQPAVMFGWVLIGNVTGGGTDVPAVRNIYNERVNPPPGGEKLDFDAMDSVLGCAASEGIILLSAYPKGAGLKPADHVVIPAGGPQLPELTGVLEPLERYHPIWLLGRPPPAITP